MKTARRILWIPFWRELILSLVLLLIVSAALGCGGPQKKTAQQETVPVFFPQPPADPRIQYLTAFRSERDFEQKPSGFQSFILGKETKEERPIKKPFGMAAHDGVIYISDLSYRKVLTINLKEKKLDAFPDKGGGELVNPLGIFIEPDGTKYIADAGRGHVVVFDPDNRYKKVLGDKKDMSPIDVVVFEERAYICDIGSHRIRVYDKRDGKFLFEIGHRGEGEGEFIKPFSLAVDSQGNLYVADAFNFRIQKFDRDGKFISTFGEAGDAPGNFSRPKGLAVDRDGLIYIVDAGLQVVKIFNPEAQALMFFGGVGLEPGKMYLPIQVYIDYDLATYFQKYVDPSFEVQYLVLVANQFGNNLVSVYGFGTLKN